MLINEFLLFLAYPDVEIHDIDEKWEFVLIASDGIWDVLSNEDVVRLCLHKIAQGIPPEQICEELMTECLSPDLLMTGTDNMTVVLICFLHNKPYEELCKRAQEYNKRYTDDENVDKNGDPLQKCDQNGSATAAETKNAINDTNTTDDDKDTRKLNGEIDNDENSIPLEDQNPINVNNADENVVNELQANNDKENTEQQSVSGTNDGNDDPKIIQESKKFKETDSETDLK